MDKSRRFCVTCGKVTSFKRPKKEEHSFCCVCGGSNSARRRDKKVNTNIRRIGIRRKKNMIKRRRLL